MVRTPDPARAPRPSAEVALLLACARTTMRDEDREAARAALRAGVDGRALLDLAREHGLTPLLHRHLSADGSARALAPAATLAALAAWARWWGARALWLANELARTVRELAAEGIPSLPLKGPLLAQRCYGSLALRQCVDLDVLVRPDDMPRVGEVLRRRGFTEESSGDAEVDAFERARCKDTTFVSPLPEYRLELHYALQPRRAGAHFGLDDFAGRLTETTLLGTPVATFAAEDLLAYLCAHGSSHAWGRIGWICDVAELLRSGEVADWARVDEAARLLQATRRVRCGLLLAAELLGAPIPDEARRADRWVRAAVRTVVARIVGERGRQPTAVETLAHQLLTDEGPGARLARLAQGLRPSADDRLALRLPRAMRPLYVLLRPVRLLLKYGPLGRLRGGAARPAPATAD